MSPLVEEEVKVIERVRQHLARRDETPVPAARPALGYDPDVLAVLFGGAPQ